jgi:3-phosphoshikimate 1-carboxyvinyltransferase
MLAALADGESVIEGYSGGADWAATLACLRDLGVSIRHSAGTVVVAGRGVRGLEPPARRLDAANSGTTLRLLAGILAAHPFPTVIGGDRSLSRRPMRRVIEPLSRMGARVDSDEGRPPLTIQGGELHGISWHPEAPSAQVKSCVLLAGLHARGRTSVADPAMTRDHTERAFRAFGVHVERSPDGTVSIEGGQRLTPRALRVPGDVSGAVFWAALAAGIPGSTIEILDVGLNPTRTAVLEILRRAGAGVESVVESETSGEPVGLVRVTYREPSGFTIEPHEVAGVIDEIPALAALAAMLPAGEVMRVRGAGELRVKESDRITALAAGLRALGADVEEFDDGFRIVSRPLTGGDADPVGDHRLAMAFAVAATRAAGPSTIAGAGCVDVSYPGFFDELARLTRAR